MGELKTRLKVLKADIFFLNKSHQKALSCVSKLWHEAQQELKN